MKDDITAKLKKKVTNTKLHGSMIMNNLATLKGEPSLKSLKTEPFSQPKIQSKMCNAKKKKINQAVQFASGLPEFRLRRLQSFHLSKS